MDIALIIDYLVPEAKYFGAFTYNTEQEYNNLNWLDDRTKPAWSLIVSNNSIVETKYKKNNCKDEAKKRIADSDWSVLPDVKISNKLDFENYRTILRNYILNPVENPIFPEEPNPIWIQPDIIIGENNG